MVNAAAAAELRRRPRPLGAPPHRNLCGGMVMLPSCRGAERPRPTGKPAMTTLSLKTFAAPAALAAAFTLGLGLAVLINPLI
jgi:hypothetical protein